jgi:chorismate mutase
MVVDIEDIRVKLNQYTEKIINGLKDRSRYPVNKGVYGTIAFDNLTWFKAMVREYQNKDAKFGRFLYGDQKPIFFEKEELEAPRVERKVPETDVNPVKYDLDGILTDLYLRTVPLICQPGEDPDTYGETADIDARNIILWNERVLRDDVAEYKWQNKPELMCCITPEAIRYKLVVPKREKQVIRDAVKLARRHELCEPTWLVKKWRALFGKEVKSNYASKGAIEFIFRSLIDTTVDVEVKYILAKRKPKIKTDIEAFVC